MNNKKKFDPRTINRLIEEEFKIHLKNGRSPARAFSCSYGFLEGIIFNFDFNYYSVDPIASRYSFTGICFCSNILGKAPSTIHYTCVPCKDAKVIYCVHRVGRKLIFGKHRKLECPYSKYKTIKKS